MSQSHPTPLPTPAPLISADGVKPPVPAENPGSSRPADPHAHRPLTPGRLPPMSPQGLRAQQAVQLPILADSAQWTPIAGSTDGEIESMPAYRPTGAEASSNELERLQARLAVVRGHNDVYAAWAAVPIAAWGGLTLAGCVYHLHFLTAAAVALVTMTGCAVPFLMHGRWRRYGVGLGVIFSLFGWTLLDQVGDILTPATERVYIWLTALESSQTAGGAVRVAPLPPTVDQMLSAVGVGLVGLLTLWSLVQAVRFIFHERKKWRLIGRIEIEAARLECEIARQTLTRQRLG